jgi:hypothetical protein
MKEAAHYRRHTGILDADGKRHTIDAYAFLKLGSMDDLRAALWILGGVGLGFKFPEYAMDQFERGRVWEVKGAWGQWFGLENYSGGHYVPAIGIAENGNIITVSWGKEQEMTPEFYLRYADEVLCWLDLDRLHRLKRVTPQGFNEARLRHDLELVAAGRVHVAELDQPTDWLGPMGPTAFA